MAKKTKDQIQPQIDTIRAEIVPGANSKDRNADLHQDMLDSARSLPEIVAFNQEFAFSEDKYMSPHVMAGDVTITLAAAGNINGVVIAGVIQSDGASFLDLSDANIIILHNEFEDDAGVNFYYMARYYDGKIWLSIYKQKIALLPVPVPEPYGDIYRSANATTIISDWAMNSGSLTQSGGYVVMPTATGNGWQQRMYLDSGTHQYTMLEKWTIWVKFKCPTISSGSYGFSAGVASRAAGGVWDNAIKLNLTTAAQGEFQTFAGNTLSTGNGTEFGAAGGSASMAGSTKYWAGFSRDVFTLKGELYDSTKTTLLSSHSNVMDSNVKYGHATGSFTIWNHMGGGLELIDEIWIETPEWKFARCLFRGHSIVSGVDAVLEENRYENLHFAGSGLKHVVSAGPYNNLADCDLCNAEIAALQPRYIVDMSVSNNSTATVGERDDLVADINAFRAYQFANNPNLQDIYQCQEIPRNSQDFTDWAARVVTEWPDKYIHTFHPSLMGTGTNLNPAYTNDNVHLDVPGHPVMESLIDAAGFGLNVP